MKRLVGLSATCGEGESGLGMADAIDDKKLAEAIGTDAAYDVLEKDFHEVRRAQLEQGCEAQSLTAPLNKSEPQHRFVVWGCRSCRSFNETSLWNASGPNTKSCSKLSESLTVCHSSLPLPLMSKTLLGSISMQR